ncbi:uncharacterized protein MONOS_13344 [Monocercomonoides exilis]|uniref:uncharacterized protein n=1 Tax=Monocercomonoides exilis TaxID=2049356 RepID=UPI00355A37F1|nr:hypothetical protein MONOS_13344 [Monocercomonoides exilis]|eukprot:MONOS_13344.1-p1 / transcript=MONOS_13344.1 / gene=MONOS_13344 / organism=Monocercomonoides_exilis_PA203 / gene_product=unspecified product / transcript_product=unspecified product / location=Mono_scaffold00813:3280-4187(-) / protein_length=284 / sequence_SO=supercontig / SO=protein_coding / is_pseudo=false
MPCLLKVALNKEESDEVQKEVEIALQALRCISRDYSVKKELYLNEIKEIIEYHQEHHNLTRLAYQSAWGFLINRFDKDKSLEEVIINELHFGREATRELEELSRNVNWKKKEEKIVGKEKEEILLAGCLNVIHDFFEYCRLWNEEYVGLINSLVQLFRAAKDNHRGISNWCIYSLRKAAENRFVKVEDLLKGGAVEAVLEEMQGRTVDDGMLFNCLQFFKNVSNRLEEEEKDEKEEEERKATKRKVFEKMEEEGCEDIITSFYEKFVFLNRRYYHELSLKISD